MNNADADLPEEYLQGFAIFLGNRIGLSRHVLIPRPETEFWTERAINDLKASGKNDLRVLDIFSGSGCIGIAVAKSLPRAMVDFADMSDDAVRQIEGNIGFNDIDKKLVNIYNSDIFNSVPRGCLYDAILANPPYIDPARIDEIQPSVLGCEPSVALFGGKGGLEIIEAFLEQAASFLKPDGFIYLEFDVSQLEAIENMAEAGGYASISFFKDQFGEWRFAKINK